MSNLIAVVLPIQLHAALRVLWCDTLCFSVQPTSGVAQRVMPTYHVSLPMRTIGEIEAAIGQCVSHIMQEFMGRGPKDIRVYLIGDLVLVRLKGVLTAAEQRLVTVSPSDKGRDLLKQMRRQMVELARPMLEEKIYEITGANIVSLHDDVSTSTGEGILIFILTEPPMYREPKKKQP